MRFTINEMLARLPLPPNDRWPEGVYDVEPFKKSNITLVFFAPKGEDYQTFHEQDEFYFIVRGSGEIVIDGKRTQVSMGDALFVEAGLEHRFENFTGDFATWAVFF